MRIALVATALSLVAAPAAAQDLHRAPSMPSVEQLNDPVVQEGLAAAVSAFAGIVLDTRVGPLAQYVDPDARPGDTLRDIKRRDDPAFEARLHDDARRAIGTAGVVARDSAVTAAELGRTAARLRAAVAPLAGLLASAAQRDDDY